MLVIEYLTYALYQHQPSGRSSCIAWLNAVLGRSSWCTALMARARPNKTGEDSSSSKCEARAVWTLDLDSELIYRLIRTFHNTFRPHLLHRRSKSEILLKATQSTGQFTHAPLHMDLLHTQQTVKVWALDTQSFILRTNSRASSFTVSSRFVIILLPSF